MSAHESGEADFIAIVILAIIGLAAYGGYALFKKELGSEVEGVVRYDDCRQTIQLKSRDDAPFGRQFVCNTQTTLSGVRMTATCASVETTPDGKCERVYVFGKSAAVTCPSASPWLGYDDKCHGVYVPGSVHASP